MTETKESWNPVESGHPVHLSPVRMHTCVPSYTSARCTNGGTKPTIADGCGILLGLMRGCAARVTLP